MAPITFKGAGLNLDLLISSHSPYLGSAMCIES